MPIESFVAKKGWKGFRAIERNVLLSLAGGDSMVISTGGGAILHKEPFEMLREKSWVLWLDAEPETIRERMKAGNDIRKRPPLKGMDPLSEIEAVLSERKQVYRDLSHHTIRTDVKKPMEIAFSALMRFLACHGYQSPGSREGKSICLETP
jgi:shikimate kinase